MMNSNYPSSKSETSGLGQLVRRERPPEVKSEAIDFLSCFRLGYSATILARHRSFHRPSGGIDGQVQTCWAYPRSYPDRPSRRLSRSSCRDHDGNAPRPGLLVQSNVWIETLDFVLESACARAEETIADQVHFVLSPKQWKAFTEALERPARAKPGLRKLLTEPSVLESR